MNISIEERLGLVSFEIDNEKHIKVDTSRCSECNEKTFLYFCPTKRFTNENGKIKHDYEGCIECGTCKFACQKGVVDFNFPRVGYGVYYKYG